MKAIFIVLMLNCIFISGRAQVYTFNPPYSAKMIYGGGGMDELWFEKIDESTHNTFVVDIDKKTITIPEYSTPKDIIKVTRDEKNNIIYLKIQGNREIGQVWCYYELKMDHEGKPVYIQSVERLTGKRFSEDTFFHMYTTDLRTLSFARRCTNVKSNMALNADKEKAKEEINLLFNSKFGEGYNVLEMRNGYVTWTEGKGKRASVRQFRIDSVEHVSEEGLRGALLRCSDQDGIYHVFYMYTKRNLDPSQYTWSRFITIDKFEGTRRKWKMVFR